MSKTISIQFSIKKFSVQMRGALAVFCADQNLMNAVVPLINFETEAILWDEMFEMPFGPNHMAAIEIAYGIATDKLRPNINFLDATLNMDAGLQAGILRGFALRWGLKS